MTVIEPTEALTVEEQILAMPHDQRDELAVWLLDVTARPRVMWFTLLWVAAALLASAVLLAWPTVLGIYVAGVLTPVIGMNAAEFLGSVYYTVRARHRGAR